MTAIFAAFMGALALVLSPVWTRVSPIYPHPLSEALFGLAGDLTFAGALLGVGAVLAGGIPLAVSAWRTSPRSRSLLLVPIPALIPAIACSLLAEFLMLLGILDHQYAPILPALLF